MTPKKKPSGQYCVICMEVWKKDQLSVQCSKCKRLVHGPSEKKYCSLISIDEYNDLEYSGRLKNWICPFCVAGEFPFSSLYDNEFNIQFQPNIKNPAILPDSNTQVFIDNCNKINMNTLEKTSDDYSNIFDGINSKYYGIHELNKIKVKSDTSLSMCHLNIASLNKHFDDLHQTLSSLKIKFDIIGISEHKINNTHGPILNLDIEGYKPFIYDSSPTSHGGTGFYISDTINYKKRDDLVLYSPGDFESTFIEVIIPNRKNMVIGCLYRHPSSKISITDFTNGFIDPLLNKISTEGNLFSLMGDFNIDLLKSDKTDNIKEFYTTFSSHFCAPFILQPTRPSSGTLIDNIFINSIDFKSHSGNLTILLSDHFMQFVVLEGFFKNNPHIKNNIRERDFKNFNEREFKETLSGIGWESVLQLDANDPNLSLANFHEKINFLLDECAPFRKLSKKDLSLKNKPWIDNTIIKKIRKRDKLLKKYNRCKDVVQKNIILNDFKVLRNEVTKLKRKSKESYYKHFFEKHKTNTATIWKGINSIVKLKSSSIKNLRIIDDNGSLNCDPLKIANCFNKYFSGIGPNLEKNIPSSSKSFSDYLSNVNVNSSFFMDPTSPIEVSDIIKSLDTKKALGPNSIPSFILKVNNDFFSEHLSKMINLTFETGTFPDLCKVAKVVPVFKSGNENTCENYRPISLLPIYSKIYEKVMYSRIYRFLTKKNLIYNKQFGFRSNYSTNHAIISLTEEIKSYLDTGHMVCGIFLDLKKAFDTINHGILLKKLYVYGFRGISNKLLQSYLENRKQFVSINGHNSELKDVVCGVPQGSTLGPLLFLIYINDLRFCLKKSKANHFADDTCITYTSKNKKDLEVTINNDLASVSDWLKANRLSLNVSKTKLLIFHSKKKRIDQNEITVKLDGTTLTPTDYTIYLGMLIDENLSWDTHINKLCSKLARINGIISKLRHFIPKRTLISVYHALFHSQILYGCSAWSLSTLKNIQTINVLQKKCLRIINFKPFNSHTNDLFASNKIIKLNDLINMEQINLAFQFKHKLLPKDLMSLFHSNDRFNTRNMTNGGFIVPRIKTLSYGERSLRYSVPLIWNEFIKSNDFNKFKSPQHLRSYLKLSYLCTYTAVD